MSDEFDADGDDGSDDVQRVLGRKSMNNSIKNQLKK